MLSIKNEIDLQDFIKQEVVNDDILKYSFSYPCPNNYSNCFPFEITFSPGFFFLECWGASGTTFFDEDTTAEGGKDGYSSGVLVVQKRKTLYLHIGGSVNITHPDYNSPPVNNTYNGCFSGGNNGFDGVGGGATDFRTKSGDWSDHFDSRIIVAGGGGSGRSRSYNQDLIALKGGDGGGEEGKEGEGLECKSAYGTINESYFPKCSNSTLHHKEGEFGYGASSGWSGGGGGYYGGGLVFNGAGGGGSGYIGNLQSIGNYTAITTTSSHNGFGFAQITILTKHGFLRQFMHTYPYIGKVIVTKTFFHYFYSL